MDRLKALEIFKNVAAKGSFVKARGLLRANNAEALLTAAVRGSGLALLPHFLSTD